MAFTGQLGTRYSHPGLLELGVAGPQIIDLVAWSADISQRALLEILTDGGELDYLPPLVLPPTGMVERTITRASVTLDPADVIIDANGRARAPDDSYTVVGGNVGVPHLLIGGVDVTYVRGVPVALGQDQQQEPFGDVTLKLDLPQLTPLDTQGAGDLAWLVPGAPVEIILLNGSTTTRLWAGHLISDDGGNDATTPRTAWVASGTLWQASTFGHRVPTIMGPTDIGTVIPGALNGVVARRYPAIKAVTTSIQTRVMGAYTDSELAYSQALLATAWTSSTQWTITKAPGTARTYLMATKDVTTVHHTVTVGAPGVDVTLSRDLTSTANTLFGRGVDVNGYAWAGWCYPNLMPDNAPAYPFTDPSNTITVGTTDADTNSGTGVSDWQRRAGDLNLTGKVSVTGIYDAGDAAVCEVIQNDYGLSVDGVVGPQTWDATFSVGSGGGDLNGSYRRPLAIDPPTEPNLYSASGAITGPNPAYTAAMRFERDTDYGVGVSKADATSSAVLELARGKAPGLTGQIILLSDPREGSRFLIQPGQNIQVLGYGGANPLLHIATVTRDWTTLAVTLSVDENAHDAMTLASIQARILAAAPDPGRRPGPMTRASQLAPNIAVPYDGESNAGIIPRHALFGGLWTVIRVPVSQVGVIAQIDVSTDSPAAPFVLALFGAPITPAHLVSLVGDPLTGTNPFARTGAAATALDNLGLIEAFGGPGSAAGYWPGQQSTDPLTGRYLDTAGVSYISTLPPWVWVAEYSPTSTFISGRVYPAPRQ